MSVKMNILGINLDCLSYEEMYPFFDKWLANKEGRSHCMALVNVNCCVSALFDKEVREIYNSADIVGIDSMPFLMWARMFFKKGSDRFYAPDLMHEVSKKSKGKGYTYFLYGGYPGSADRIEEYLKDQYEGINVVGKYSPPFRPLTEQEDQEIIDMINEAKPDFLWIGLGSPKQDIWLQERLEKIRGSIIVPSGATFDFFSGRIQQAPRFIRNIGFEWLYRLFKDFRRLWKRYTVYNFIFLTVFALQLLGIVRFKTQE